MNIFPGGKESGLFEAFTAPDADRLSFLERLLKANSVPCSVVNLRGRSHIIVRFGKTAYNPFFKMKTLIAHYDRDGVGLSPGANDNSAACFMLVDLAVKLLPVKDHNVRIIFSGAEEAGLNGVASQGAFTLGLGLRKLKLTDSDVFVLDACGRGDTLIVSTSGLYTEGKKLPGNFIKKREELFQRATDLAKKNSSGWLSLPTPYSDNAGLTAAGIPAQLITVLPHSEAEKLLEALKDSRARNGDISSIESRIFAFNSGKNKQPETEDFIPLTWQDMHGVNDSIENLSPTAFSLMETFLSNLANLKTPC